MNYADLIQIVELLRQSEQFSSFKLKTPELELEVLREGAPIPNAPGEHKPAASLLPCAPLPAPPAPTTSPA